MTEEIARLQQANRARGYMVGAVHDGRTLQAGQLVKMVLFRGEQMPGVIMLVLGETTKAEFERHRGFMGATEEYVPPSQKCRYWKVRFTD